MQSFHLYFISFLLLLFIIHSTHSWSPMRSGVGRYFGFSPFEFPLDDSMMPPQSSSHSSMPSNFGMNSPPNHPSAPSLVPSHPQQAMQPVNQAYPMSPSPYSPHDNIIPNYLHRNFFVDSMFPQARSNPFPPSFTIPKYPNNNLLPFASTLNQNISDCRCMPIHMCSGKPLGSMFNSPLDAPATAHPMQLFTGNYRTFNSEDRKKRYLALKNGPSPGERSESEKTNDAANKQCRHDEVCCSMITTHHFNPVMNAMMPPVSPFSFGPSHPFNPYYAYASYPNRGAYQTAPPVRYNSPPPEGSMYARVMSPLYPSPLSPPFAPPTDASRAGEERPRVDDRSNGPLHFDSTDKRTENGSIPVPTMTHEVKQALPLYPLDFYSS